MKKILAFLFFVLEAAAVGIAYAGAGECSNATSHVEQRSCLEAQFREAEKRLTLTEQSTMAKIAAWDEDTGYRSASKKALSASNSAFRKYRANQCEYEWSLAAGGNGATDMRLSCAIELTQSRIKLLEDSAAGPQKR